MKYRDAIITGAALAAVALISACQPKDGRVPYAPKTSPAIGTRAIVTCKGPILNECATRQHDGSYILHRQHTSETARLDGPCVLRAENKGDRTYIYVTMKKGCYQ